MPRSNLPIACGAVAAMIAVPLSSASFAEDILPTRPSIELDLDGARPDATSDIGRPPGSESFELSPDARPLYPDLIFAGLSKGRYCAPGQLARIDDGETPEAYYVAVGGYLLSNAGTSITVTIVVTEANGDELTATGATKLIPSEPQAGQNQNVYPVEATALVLFGGNPVPAQIAVFVDSDNRIQEGDEGNNAQVVSAASVTMIGPCE